MTAHWRHLANMIEPVHPSAHSSPQPKRQMDRFSRFLHSLRQKVPILYSGCPYPPELPFPMGISTSHVTHDALGLCEPTTQTAPRSVQPCLHRWPQSVPILVCLFPPQNCSLPCWHLDLMVHWFTRVRNANGNLIVSAIFPGLTSVTDWQSDRQTDRPCSSVRGGVIMHNYVGYGKATQSFHVSTNNFATIKSLSVRSKHLTKYLVWTLTSYLDQVHWSRRAVDIRLMYMSFWYPM